MRNQVLLLMIFAFGVNQIFAQSKAPNSFHPAEVGFLEAEHFNDDYELGIRPPSFLKSFTSTAIQNRSVTEHFLDSIHYSSGAKYYYEYNEVGDVDIFRGKENGVLTREGIFRYDEEMIKEVELSYYDKLTSELNYQIIYTYSYDLQKRLAELNSVYIEESGEVSRHVIERHNYTTDGQLDYIDDFLLFGEEEGLINKKEYTYDSKGRIEMIEFFYLDFLEIELQLSFQSIYAYGINEKVESWTWFDAETNTVDWVKTYEYDNDDDLVRRYFEWPNSNYAVSVLDFFYSPDFASNDNLNFDNYVLAAPRPTSIFNSGRIEFLNRYQIDENGSAVDQTYLTEYFWSSDNLETSLISSNIKQLEVFPNPVTDRLYFEGLLQLGLLQLEIYDALGRSVRSVQLLDDSQSLDVSALSKGNFFFTLSDGGAVVYHGKFVKGN